MINYPRLNSDTIKGQPTVERALDVFKVDVTTKNLFLGYYQQGNYAAVRQTFASYLIDKRSETATRAPVLPPPPAPGQSTLPIFLVSLQVLKVLLA